MDEKNINCTICFNVIDKKIVLQCKHFFCESCISKWERGTCPTCRYRFKLDDDNIILQDYIDIRIRWLDRLMINALKDSLNCGKKTLEIKLQCYKNDIKPNEIKELMTYAYERMKHNLTLLFYRSINKRQFIKDLKYIESVQNETNTCYSEFMECTNTILKESENELNSELIFQLTASINDKLIKKEQRKNILNENTTFIYIINGF